MLLNTVPVFTWARFTAWMFAGTVPLACISLLFKNNPDQNVPQIRRAAICYKGTLQTLEVLLSKGRIHQRHLDGHGEWASDGDLGGK